MFKKISKTIIDIARTNQESPFEMRFVSVFAIFINDNELYHAVNSSGKKHQVSKKRVAYRAEFI